MPFGLHLPELIIMTITVIWIVGLIHCAINGRVSGISKPGWIIFIILANWIGALAYFLYWFGFAQRQHKQRAPAMQQPLPEQEYSSYTTGYQPVRTPSAQVWVANVRESEKALSSSPPASEEMQIMYPEDPR
ncbi:MAG TPA: PLD nuclease N-terminal domain-containing protein [Ktedonobacteraceae bacterium]|jgi:hypothetical protein